MSNIRTRLADALREAIIERGLWPDKLDDLVDVVLSLPGIAIVETGQDSVAEAIYEAHRAAYGDVCWSRWAALGELGRDTYRRMAAAALVAAANAAEAGR